MRVKADRLSTISALKPVAQTHQASSKTLRSANWERLMKLVDGEVRNNRFGNYIGVRRPFPFPEVGEMNLRTLRLIAPGALDTACDPGQWLFLDTETTGLAGGTGTYAFLVGLAWWEKDGLMVEQYFMRDHSEEPSLLMGILGQLRQRRVLVTYNGKSFDWPLLQTRFQMTRVGEVPEPLAHLDLLHPARQIWRLRIGSVALERLERRILQVDRGRDIPSSTIPQRYFDFLRGGSPDAVAEVFYHNQWDLFGLASLAVRLMHMLGNPKKSDCCPKELFGLSRLLQRRGEENLAADMYQSALQGGLPAEAEQIAQRELAFMAKRASNFELSNALWEKLLDHSNEGLRAYEQLAIYYEHRASSFEKAARLCRDALVRLQESFHEGNISSLKYRQWHASFNHRLNRLQAKTEKSVIGCKKR